MFPGAGLARGQRVLSIGPILRAFLGWKGPCLSDDGQRGPGGTQGERRASGPCNFPFSLKERNPAVWQDLAGQERRWPGCGLVYSLVNEQLNTQRKVLERGLWHDRWVLLVPSHQHGPLGGHPRVRNDLAQDEAAPSLEVSGLSHEGGQKSISLELVDDAFVVSTLPSQDSAVSLGSGPAVGLSGYPFRVGQKVQVLRELGQSHGVQCKELLWEPLPGNTSGGEGKREGRGGILQRGSYKWITTTGEGGLLSSGKLCETGQNTPQGRARVLGSELPLPPSLSAPGPGSRQAQGCKDGGGGVAAPGLQEFSARENQKTGGLHPGLPM